MLQHHLSDHWSFHEESAGTAHPAQVPGCVHTDLLRNGLIPDPFYGTNEQSLQWIGEKDWIYECAFDLTPELLAQNNIELVFRGLDTYATVTLNGSALLEADNMFREWRAGCKTLLKEKNNRLAIRFRNVFSATLPKQQNAPFPLQAFGTNDQADVKLAMYSRKAQFHFGWDWGPRLITCGMWRPVLLEGWSGVRIRNVFVHPRQVTSAAADIVTIVELTADSAQEATISISMDSLELNREVHALRKGLNRVELRGHLVRPKLWWTNGLGDPYLYQYRLEVTAGGRSAEEYVAGIGVRALDIVREKDSSGTSLYVRLNGVPVFMKGANYIPQDNFQNRASRARYEYMIRCAADAHMNMLRVWGGGIFEEDTFYELCDRHGILIWHDMQFACAMYPADEAFRQNVRQEIIDNISRIRNHASIALYCGNNENDQCWHQTWKRQYSAEIQARYEKDVRALFDGTISQTLKEVDPNRYYHSSSPNAGFGGIPYSEGDIHYWGVWHAQEPFEQYRDNIGRFVSEYGFQSYPELASVKKFASDQDRTLHSPVMLAHQRCMADERRDKEYGNRLIQTYLDRWYKAPKDFESYLYVSQVMQAEGVSVGMEAHRRAMPHCMGSLYWQLDDCWPVASWSSIDYYGRWKALHYMAQRRFAPILVSPVVKDAEIEFFIVSDKLAPVSGTMEVSVLDFRGAVVFGKKIPVTVEANQSKRYAVLAREELTAGRDESELVMVSRFTSADQSVAENLTYFRLPRELSLTPPQITATIEACSGGCRIELRCQSLARAVMLSCGDDPGFFEDNYFDLLPGKKRVVEYRTDLNEKSVKEGFRARSLIDSYQ